MQSPNSLIFNLINSLLKVKALRENSRHRNYGTIANPFPIQNQTIPKCYSYSMFKSIFFFCFSPCEHFTEMVELIGGGKCNPISKNQADLSGILTDIICTLLQAVKCFQKFDLMLSLPPNDFLVLFLQMQDLER